MSTSQIRTNKSTSVFSRLGFGIAVVLFLLIWLVHILVILNYAGSSGASAGLVTGTYMIIIMLGSILGLLAMAFSIVGLIMAIKQNTPKWIGAAGIVVCVLSLLSIFVPAILGAGVAMVKTRDMKIETPPAVRDTYPAVSEDITIQILEAGRVRCVNNTDSSSGVVGNMNTYDHDFDRQLADWLKMNDVDSSIGVVVKTSEKAGYSYLITVIDALQENGVPNYRIASTSL